jgi:hypothetical protein
MIKFLFSLALVGSISLPASDNFTRADTSEDPGANWSGGVADWEINSNHLVRNVDFDFSSDLWWNADSFAQNHASEITVSDWGTYGGGPLVHGSGGYFASTFEGYYSNCSGSAGLGWVIIKVTTGGATTTLNSGGSPASCDPGDLLRLEATGTGLISLTLKQNGSIIGTATDSTSPLSGGASGIQSFTTTSHQLKISLWGGENLAGGGPTFPFGILPNIPVKMCCKRSVKF